MSHRILSSFRQFLRAFYVRGIQLLTADEMTRLSWARRVDTYASVPEVYSAYLESALPQPQAFPGGVLTPTYRGFLHPENERLVFRLGDRVHIVERRSDSLNAVVLPLTEIDTVERGSILLRAWMSLTGCDTAGQPQKVMLKYNTVTEHLFFPLLEAFRKLSIPIEKTGDELSPQTRAAINALEPLSIKFRNYARSSLQPGEQIQASIYQPEIRRPRLQSLGRVFFWRRLCPNHLCLLTDSELILICEDPDTVKSVDQHAYGGIWTYVPRRRISAAALEPAASDCLCLHVSMLGGSNLDRLFSISRRNQLEQMVSLLP